MISRLQCKSWGAVLFEQLNESSGSVVDLLFKDAGRYGLIWKLVLVDRLLSNARIVFRFPKIYSFDILFKLAKQTNWFIDWILEVKIHSLYQIVIGRCLQQHLIRGFWEAAQIENYRCYASNSFYSCPTPVRNGWNECSEVLRNHL